MVSELSGFDPVRFKEAIDGLVLGSLLAGNYYIDERDEVCVVLCREVKERRDVAEFFVEGD